MGSQSRFPQLLAVMTLACVASATLGCFQMARGAVQMTCKERCPRAGVEPRDFNDCMARCEGPQK